MLGGGLDLLRTGVLAFVLANVHLYFGEESEEAGMDRRCLGA